MARAGAGVDSVRAAAPGGDEERVRRLVAAGKALSDPVRVRMLGMMAEGRGCCGLPGLEARPEGQETGICVCEFVGLYGMGQSRVSYHLGKLKEAGLVRERRRGKWSYYSVDEDAVREVLGAAAGYLGVASS